MCTPRNSAAPRIAHAAEANVPGVDGWRLTPLKTLTAQRRWIGRSEGAEIVFAVDGHPDARIAVFTTRPDTLMGATYVVLKPEK